MWCVARPRSLSALQLLCLCSPSCTAHTACDTVPSFCTALFPCVLRAGPDGYGAVTVGMRTLSEAGSVGVWDREQIMVFCVSNLINCAMEADEVRTRRSECTQPACFSAFAYMARYYMARYCLLS